MISPRWKVYYGDKLDNWTQFPADDVVEVSNLRYQLEPGKPGTPKQNNVAVKLDNLNQDFTEKYPDSWFDSAKNTAAPTFQTELFLKVELFGKSFIGLYASRSYSDRRQHVTIDVKDLFGLIRDLNVPPVKSMSQDASLRAIIPNATTSNDVPDITALNTSAVPNELLRFRLEISDQDPPVFSSEIADFIFASNLTINNIDETDSTEPEPTGDQREAFWQINDVTLLTRVKFWVNDESSTIDRFILYADVWHLDLLPDGPTFPIGHYAGSDGGELATGSQQEITFHGVPFSNTDETIIIESDLPSQSYLAGLPIDGQGNVQQGDFEHFDIIDLYTTGLTRIVDRFFTDTANNTIFMNQADAMLSFWSDFAMWASDENVQEIVEGLVIASNSYFHQTEAGNLAFSSRLAFEAFDATNPPPTLDPDLIFPDGSRRRNAGFDTFESSFNQIVPISNIKADEDQDFKVNEQQLVSNDGQRSASVDTLFYRTGDLGVEQTLSGTTYLFRYSPDDAGSAITPALADFIRKPEEALIAFATTLPFQTEMREVIIQLHNPASAHQTDQIALAAPLGIDDEIWMFREINYNSNDEASGIIQKLGVIA